MRITDRPNCAERRMRARHSVASILLLLAWFLVAGPGGTEAGSFSNARNALLIGNATYPDSDAALSTPLGDVKSLGEALRAKGFTVATGENLSKDQMQAAIDGFLRKVEPGSIALVFYGGYGIQVARKNYLVPVNNSRIWSEADVMREGISVDTLLADLERKGAGTRVIVLDASRRNPFERRFRSFSTGLAEIKASPGHLSLSSTAPGSVVNEVSTAQSPFVTELIRQIGVSENSAVQAFTATREAVSRDSRNQQVPALSAGLESSFYFDTTRRWTEPQNKADLGPKPNRAEVPQESPAGEANKSPGKVPGGKGSDTKTQGGKLVDPEPANSIDQITQAEEAAAGAFNKSHAIGTKKAYQDFLAQYPKSTTSNRARAEIARLDGLSNSGFTNTQSDAGAESDPPPLNPRPYSQVELQRKLGLDARIARNGKDSVAFYERGQFHAQRNDYTSALTDFDQAIRLNPRSPEALNNRCWVRAVTNDLTRALADCNEALRLRPKFVDALDSRGFINLKSGSLQAAVEDYDAALAMAPNHSSALYGRGIARSRLGQRRQATDDLTGALALNPMIDKDFAQYGLR